MQKFLFVFAIVLSMSIGSIASAAQQSRVSRSEAGAARKGPVAKLIELERRKNDWLREKMGR
ncbi:MAG: hypothetical protein WCR23_10235 [Planctomycetota bacterium]|jgi:hypothetical protein|nr:hypothetical protein [Planctomycetia bacterium]MDO7677576.1 hypothetical protein [Pirellulales bacterium]RLS29087.1 MAG: hypothetical protein DWH80_16195 [Planctomycetota bacterium]TSA05172.1 MAG: hypothetical protein D4R77_08470 [Planctomycetaceae bacterium]RLS60666.1 MAG: hypothetical protein DWH94_02195 [Planctomycetota bacterium]